MDTDLEQLRKEMTALETERSTWLEDWREIGDYIRPGRYRYLVTDRNKGTKRGQAIINNTATVAGRTTAAGIMAGFFNQSKPWFELTVANAQLAQVGAVKDWLDEVAEIIRDAMSRSGVYNCLHDLCEVLVHFGTAALYVEEDVENVARGYVFPTGQYCLANSARGVVDTIHRKFSLTACQMVEKFGRAAVSQDVLRAYDEGRGQEWVEVIHVIRPRKQREPARQDARNMAWRSVWYEAKADINSKPLRDSGYVEFPVMAPRWGVTGEDVYGRSPGMDAIGDVKALQEYEKSKAILIEQLADPAVNAPASMRNQRLSLLPGKVNWVDREGKAEPVYLPQPQAVAEVREAIQDHERRIDRTYYSDLWLALLNSEGPQMTAEEVRERSEEKMLQLGPVTERLEVEVADPLITRFYGILSRAGALPPPPPEAQGQGLVVKYSSIMSQARKLIASTGIQRVIAMVGAMQPQQADVVDNVDYDQVVTELTDAYDLSPRIVRPADQVAALRQARAQAQQQQEAAQQALAAAQGAKTLSEADMSGDSALTRMLPGVAAT